jgi:hypothetical protein
MRLEEQIYFSSENLDNLSAIVMYGFDPSQPFKNDMGRMSPIRISNFSQQFSYLDGYKKQEEKEESYFEIMERIAKEFTERRKEEERQKKSKPLCSASLFGLGPGVAKETEFGYIERYLPPHTDEAHGEHINLGSYLPDKKGKLYEFLNIHIDLNDDKNED